MEAPQKREKCGRFMHPKQDAENVAMGANSFKKED